MHTPHRRPTGPESEAHIVYPPHRALVEVWAAGHPYISTHRVSNLLEAGAARKRALTYVNHTKRLVLAHFKHKGQRNNRLLTRAVLRSASFAALKKKALRLRVAQAQCDSRPKHTCA